MKNALQTTLTLALVCAALPWAGAAHADPRQASAGRHDRVEIERLLKNYEQALNAGDVQGVVRLYTDDAVLLAPESPSAVGLQSVQAAYAATFQAIGLNISFQIAELKPLSRDWALLRTNSTGSIRINANGASVPEGNQELFLLQSRQGQWKIARYSFSTSLPAAR